LVVSYFCPVAVKSWFENIRNFRESSVELPVAYWNNDINKHDKANCYVDNREPWCNKWASMISRDTGPVQSECTNTKPMIAGPDLLCRDAVWPNPAHPGEECQYRKEVAR
jgi:hypothetical protein